MLIEDRIYRLIKLLLHVAKEENTEVTATKLQKIFFLLEKEQGIQLGLDFKPWFFGPYSSRLQDYIDKLIELEEIDVEEEEVRDPLSEEVIAYKRYYVLKSELKPEEDRPIETFFREWVRKSRTDKTNDKPRPFQGGVKFFRRKRLFSFRCLPLVNS